MTFVTSRNRYRGLSMKSWPTAGFRNLLSANFQGQ